jgi:acetone carboxylase, gamma subunit
VLVDLLEERLPRRAVKDIQSGYKDPDRVDKWLEVLQERVSYDDPIVLPCGEGLNVVRRSWDGELVIRCDCGHELCRHDQNWKMNAVIHVRDDESSMREVYPAMAHAGPEWMELRELYCPSCAGQLEVEATPPGYPLTHDFLPASRGSTGGGLGRELR